jgi:cytochrome c-type biogenesis protein CcmH
MIFWILAALMAAAVVAAVAWPLLRSRMNARQAADYDIEIYRDQLAEVEQSHERGQIGDADAEAAKAEIGRRILAADQRRSAAEDMTGASSDLRRALAAILAVSVPAGAIALYLELGSPGMEGMPFAERDIEENGTQVARGNGGSGSDNGQQGQAPQLREAEQNLAVRLNENPQDADGWILLA